MLLDPKVIDDILEYVGLNAQDLHRPAHQMLFTILATRRENGLTIDPEHIARDLDDQGLLRTCGGRPYLLTLIAATPPPGHAEYHTHLVRQNAADRRAHLLRADTDIAATEPRPALRLVRGREPGEPSDDGPRVPPAI
ncbi:DnaB-like helicase N-terminal domain-containing protein [Embleya sp. NPDC127516]|uniref:DnaB-like helicase N-terminal domain-containing protein n=1 Tax=Embleya sp. NPDC127516 TaxID=3363990 RepID=UPI003803EBA3